MTEKIKHPDRDEEILDVKKSVHRDFKDGVMVFPGVYLNMSAAFFWEASAAFATIRRSDLRRRLVDKIKNNFLDLPPDAVLEKDVDEFIDDCIKSGLMTTSKSVQRPEIKSLPKDTGYIPKVELVLTHNCNFRCRHCFIEAKKEMEKELPFHQWERALDKLLNMGLINLTLSGGEPGCWPHLADLLKKLEKGPEVFINILSNGSLLGSIELVEILERLKHRLNIQISLNSINEEGFRNFTAQNTISLRHTLKNIRMLIMAGLDLKIVTQADAENMEFILNGDFLAVLQDLGVKKWVVQPNWRSIGRALKPGNSMRAQVEQSHDFVRRLEKSLAGAESSRDVKIIMDALPSLTHGTVFYPEDHLYSACKGYSNSVAVNADGDIFVCSEFISFGKNIVGNIFDLSEKEIIASLNKVKGRMRKEVESISGACTLCVLKETCRGGCRADAFGSQNRDGASPPVCEELMEKGLFPKELMTRMEATC